jgi:hypothetical protein
MLTRVWARASRSPVSTEKGMISDPASALDRASHQASSVVEAQAFRETRAVPKCHRPLPAGSVVQFTTRIRPDDATDRRPSMDGFSYSFWVYLVVSRLALNQENRSTQQSLYFRLPLNHPTQLQQAGPQKSSSPGRYRAGIVGFRYL